MTTVPRPTVLCVDDEESVRLSLEMELEDHFNVVTMGSGAAALDLLSRRRIDAMLLDLNMPDMGGEEVLQLLRASGSRVPVVMFTVVEELARIVRCMKLGAAAYVTKPQEPGELVRSIEEALREARAAPGVLLVSDDPVALAPLKLALQSQIRVATMKVADALQSSFPALAVVINAPVGAGIDTLAGVPLRFARAEVIWVGDLHADGLRVPLRRLDLTLDQLSNVLELSTARRGLAPAVLRAIELMVQHCPDPLTTSEIAFRVGVSDDHLSRLFRAAFGWTAIVYYTRLRVEVACRLLCDTEKTIEEIAEQVGYSSAPNFSRAFKSVTGKRPAEFRRESR